MTSDVCLPLSVWVQWCSVWLNKLSPMFRWISNKLWWILNKLWTFDINVNLLNLMSISCEHVTYWWLIYIYIFLLWTMWGSDEQCVHLLYAISDTLDRHESLISNYQWRIFLVCVTHISLFVTCVTTTCRWYRLISDAGSHSVSLIWIYQWRVFPFSVTRILNKRHSISLSVTRLTVIGDACSRYQWLVF